MRLGYARVSTGEQSEALSAQVARLEGAGCDRIIQEQVSGGKNDRDGLMEAMRLVRSGRVGQLVCTRVDRLGRDGRLRRPADCPLCPAWGRSPGTGRRMYRVRQSTGGF